jgi:integrase
MGSIQKRGRDRWKARYTAPDGRERSKTFTTETAAKDFLAQRTLDVRRGDWIDPRLARTTVGDYALVWLDRKRVTLKPSTVASYQGLLRTCILPDWDRVPLGNVAHGDLAAWIARLTTRLSASRTRHAHIVMSQILDSAVADGMLTKNPAKNVGLPRLPEHREHRALTIPQLNSLADACGGYRLLVLVLGFCGLRFGEAAALRVRSLDFLRGRLRVTESVTELGGVLTWGTPKNHQSRSVPVPKFLLTDLTDHVGGRHPDDLVFTGPEGGPLRSANFRRRVWDPATARLGLPVVPHDLRHTAVSLAILEGADVKAVQRLAGHRSATTTLDVYAELFDTTLDSVADRLDAAYRASDLASPWPGPVSNVVPLTGDGG